MVLAQRADLGHGNVKKLLFSLSVPTITSQIVNMLYNLVDRVFIGHMQPAETVGKLALTGVGVCLPIIMIISAFASLMAIGGAPRASIADGAGESERSERIMGNCLTMLLITSFVLTILFEVFAERLLLLFGASENTIPYAREYMLVVLAGNVFSQTFFGMNAILRAVGKPRHAMFATMSSVVLNTVLAPIFIWPLKMGIQGAALATVISQVTALAWQLWLFSKSSEIVHFKKGIYKLRSNILKNIIGIGMSPFAMNVCACIVVIFINTSLYKYGGDMAVGAYGIANKVAFVFIMITMGLNQGMLPIAGYNYGAQRFDRLMKVLKCAIIAGTAITTTGFLIVHIFPYECARLFTTDAELIDKAMRAIKINMAAFPFVGYQMVVTNFFQSIGKAKISIFLSLTRQLLYLLPCLLLFPQWWGLKGVWISMPVSDALAFVTAVISLMIYIKKVSKEHPIANKVAE